MTHALNRRDLIHGLAILGAAAALPLRAAARAQARLVVIGGGFGGATAARALRHLLPAASVTLIEPNLVFTACPFSNLVIGGTRELSAQQFGYDALARDGVSVIHARADNVDPDAKTITLSDGSTLTYDRLVLSPGIDIRWDALPGYDQAAAEIMPHAWKAGAQTQLLADQLAAMPDGGRVVMSVPSAPFRCPPGPYERASLIGHYLKTQKPRSKLIILDAKDSFSKMPLFQAAWTEHYPQHIEWRSASNDGRVGRVDATTRTLFTDFDAVAGEVVNVIPPQKAGEIAHRAGVADATGWCPIDATSFESTLQPGVHVIGDATIAAPMPKSAFSANLQAKVCAIAIARMIADLEPEATVLANTCYSFITPETAVSIAGVYNNAGGQFSSIEDAGGLSPVAGTPSERMAEAAQAAEWFSAITTEAFG